MDRHLHHHSHRDDFDDSFDIIHKLHRFDEQLQENEKRERIEREKMKRATDALAVLHFQKEKIRKLQQAYMKKFEWMEGICDKKSETSLNTEQIKAMEVAHEICWANGLQMRYKDIH